jgi:sentrin-specific protease 8
MHSLILRMRIPNTAAFHVNHSIIVKEGIFLLSELYVGHALFLVGLQAALLFVGPEVSQFLKLVGPGEAAGTLDSLGLAEKSLAFFAVNSQSDPGRSGGTHWSLLVYHVPSAAFYHLDSAGAANESEARSLAAAVGGKNQPITFQSLPTRASLQQSNGHDCGVFLLANAEHVARHFLSAGSAFNADGLTAVSRDRVTGFRKYLRELVLKLSQQENS